MLSRVLLKTITSGVGNRDGAGLCVALTFTGRLNEAETLLDRRELMVSEDPVEHARFTAWRSVIEGAETVISSALKPRASIRPSSSPGGKLSAVLKTMVRPDARGLPCRSRAVLPRKSV